MQMWIVADNSDRFSGFQQVSQTVGKVFSFLTESTIDFVRDCCSRFVFHANTDRRVIHQLF